MKNKLQTTARWLRENGDTLLEIAVFAIAFITALSSSEEADKRTRK